MSEWNRTQKLMLSSGREVELRRVTLEELVVMGQVPNSLSAVVARILNDPDIANKPATELFGGDPVEAVKSATEFNKAMLTLALVNPKLTDVPNYKEGEASYFDLTDAERNEIIAWINGPVEQLEPFPE
jgi:hypothetical protein